MKRERVFLFIFYFASSSMLIEHHDDALSASILCPEPVQDVVVGWTQAIDRVNWRIADLRRFVSRGGMEDCG